MRAKEGTRVEERVERIEERGEGKRGREITGN